MTGGVEFQVRGDKKAAVDLRKVGERGSDIRRVSEKVRRVYRDSNERRFGGYGHWPANAPATLEKKTRLGQDMRVERATGALYRSLTSARAAGQVDVRNPQEFRFGTDLPYARYQQGTRHQPARDLIELSPAERKKVSDLISAYIARSET